MFPLPDTQKHDCVTRSCVSECFSVDSSLSANDQVFPASLVYLKRKKVVAIKIAQSMGKLLARICFVVYQIRTSFYFSI